MHKKDDSSIQTKFLRNMISIAVVSIALWSLIWVHGEFAGFREMSHSLRIDYIESQKEMLRYQVARVIDYIIYTKDILNGHGIKESDNEDINRMHKLILDYVSVLRFGTDGYFFGSTWQGLPLFSDGRITMGTDSIWELTDPNGIKIIQEQQKKARQPGGGFVEYVWHKLESPHPSPKISFVAGIPEWQWTIGAGVYLDTIETVIQTKRKAFESRLVRKIVKSLFVSAVFIGLILLWSRQFCSHIQQEINRIVQFLTTANIDGLTIEPESFYLEELKMIADSINKMFIAGNQTIAKLKKSENRNRAMISAIPDVLFLIDKDFRFVDYHSGNERLWIFPKEEIIGKTLHQCMPPDMAVQAEDKVRKIMQTGKIESYEYTIEINGETIFFDARMVPYDSKHALVISRDMTAQKKIKFQMELLAMAVKHTAEAIIIMDGEGRIEYVNPSFETITGYGSQEAMGQKPCFLKSDEQDREVYRNMVKSLKTCHPWQGRLINRRKDGTLFHEHVSISPVMNSADEITHYVSVNRDMSYEIMMEQRLMQAQKMEAIGSLAGGIAHDFNNILFPIIGHAEILMKDLSCKNSLYNNADKIYQAALRARDLVQQILTFSRRNETKIIPVNLRPIVKEAVKLLRAFIPKTIDIELRIDSDVRKVLADSTQVHQVIMNLATNAYHAMDDDNGGTLLISLEHQYIKISPRRPDLKPAPGSYMKLTVADTGPGIPENILSRIFDPYFTTKPEGKGTGLGLSIVHGIVKSFQGELLIESKPGQGTEVCIFFPVAVKGQTGMMDINNTPVPTGIESVLFVDDEDFIVEIQTEILQRLGYRVTSATGSAEALNIFQKDPDGFDLLITDMTMPGMTGVHLAEEIKQISPDIPVIICTGFNRSISRKKYRNMNIDGYVSKPVNIKEMADTVRKVIDDAKK